MAKIGEAKLTSFISLIAIFTISEGIVLQNFDLRFVLDGLQEMNSSSPCKFHIQEYLKGLASGKRWAFKS